MSHIAQINKIALPCQTVLGKFRSQWTDNTEVDVFRVSKKIIPTVKHGGGHIMFWKHEFCSLPQSPEGERLAVRFFVNVSPSTLRLLRRTLTNDTPSSVLLHG